MTGYREALESGEATRDGSGLLDGRGRMAAVRDCRAASARRGACRARRRRRGDARAGAGRDARRRQAVDAATISVAETLDRASVSFARPSLVPPGQEPVVDRDVASTRVSLEEARAALDGRLLGGASLAGLPRRAVTLKTVAVGYGEDSGREPRRVPSVELSYGAASGDEGVVVTEALEPLMLYRFGL